MTRRRLLAQLELLRECEIAVVIRGLQVIQQPAALADHDQQAAARAVILEIGLEMAGEVIDALGEQGNLHVGGAGVLGVNLVVGDDLLLKLCFHTSSFFDNEGRTLGMCRVGVKVFCRFLGLLKGTGSVTSLESMTAHWPRTVAFPCEGGSFSLLAETGVSPAVASWLVHLQGGVNWRRRVGASQGNWARQAGWFSVFKKTVFQPRNQVVQCIIPLF